MTVAMIVLHFPPPGIQMVITSCMRVPLVVTDLITVSFPHAVSGTSHGCWMQYLIRNTVRQTVLWNEKLHSVATTLWKKERGVIVDTLKTVMIGAAMVELIAYSVNYQQMPNAGIMSSPV